MPSLMDWLFGDPYQSMMGDARRDNQARYGTNEDQPPLRSVDDPTPYKEFHDDRSTTQPSYTGGYPLGGGAPLSSLYRASSADNTNPFMNYIQQLVQQLAASVPMQDPGLRYQYAPPYSPQRTDPNYEQNWQQPPQYSPPQDDTLLGPVRQAALGGGTEYRPGSGPVPGGSRVPADFMYDQQPIPVQPSGPPPMTQPYMSIQGAERLQQARQAEEQSHVAQDVADIKQGMTYGPQQLYGRQHLLPQYQNLGNIRPLGPGEFIEHPDPVTGKPSISSEETVTVQFNDGRWAVVPSLWMVNGKAMVVDEDTAAELAQRSGLNWPMFKSENEGNDWANQREQKWYRSGGRTDTQPPLWSRPWPPRQ